MFGAFFFGQPFFADFPKFGGSGPPNPGSSGAGAGPARKHPRKDFDRNANRNQIEAMLTTFLNVIDE